MSLRDGELAPFPLVRYPLRRLRAGLRHLRGFRSPCGGSGEFPLFPLFALPRAHTSGVRLRHAHTDAGFQPAHDS
jgi:hypothetical protein